MACQPLVHPVKTENPGSLEITPGVEVAELLDRPPCHECSGYTPHSGIIAHLANHGFDDQPLPDEIGRGIAVA